MTSFSTDLLHRAVIVAALAAVGAGAILDINKHRTLKAHLYLHCNRPFLARVLVFAMGMRTVDKATDYFVNGDGDPIGNATTDTIADTTDFHFGINESVQYRILIVHTCSYTRSPKFHGFDETAMAGNEVFREVHRYMDLSDGQYYPDTRVRWIIAPVYVRLPLPEFVEVDYRTGSSQWP